LILSLCSHYTSIFFYSYSHHRSLPSFPTRRSSDLPGSLAVLRGRLPGIRRPRQYHHGGADRRRRVGRGGQPRRPAPGPRDRAQRSEEHTSELQSPCNLVCRLLLEKKNNKKQNLY